MILDDKTQLFELKRLGFTIEISPNEITVFDKYDHFFTVKNPGHTPAWVEYFIEENGKLKADEDKDNGKYVLGKTSVLVIMGLFMV